MPSVCRLRGYSSTTTPSTQSCHHLRPRCRISLSCRHGRHGKAHFSPKPCEGFGQRLLLLDVRLLMDALTLVCVWLWHVLKKHAGKDRHHLCVDTFPELGQTMLCLEGGVLNPHVLRSAAFLPEPYLCSETLDSGCTVDFSYRLRSWTLPNRSGKTIS